MAELDFLDALHPVYRANRAAWQRLERRGYGRAEEELMRFVGESDEVYEARKDRATYVNFMFSHASAVTGHLRMNGAPPPQSDRFSFGTLGRIRPATEVRPGTEDVAEQIYYNIDGVGGDGTEWPVFFDAVDERAQYTGHRVLYCETPPTGGSEVSLPMVRAGIRPYLAEYSPLEMTMWGQSLGRFDFVILRVVTDGPRVVDGSFAGMPADQAAMRHDDPLPGRGYYLLVRRGCAALGEAFREGGYWLFRPDKELIRHRLWGTALGGEIPLWLHYGEQSRGTTAHPALSRSPTEGLGRIGVSLMDMLSARDWDAFDAARSGKWFSPATKNVMEAIKEQWDAKSLHIGIPMAFDETTGASSVVTVTDDSSGAVAPAVFQAIIDAKFTEAREQSFQALTSLPGSSGVSKERGFEDVKAPYLARRAALRQSSEQNAIRFLEMRAGQAPTGFCLYGRTYNLQPVVDDIDATLETLRLSQLRSPTLEPELVLRSVRERFGSVPLPPSPTGGTGATEDDVRRELTDSVRAAQAQDAAAQGLQSAFGA